MALTQSERSLRWRTKYPEKHKAAHENWRVENKEKRNAYARKWHAEKRATDPDYAEKVRKHALKRRYGISPAEYDALLTKQNGHCALCPSTGAETRHKKLHVDHCHDTGKIRGLLCIKCNHGLGRLGDSEAGLLRALEYVRGGV